MKRIFLWSVIAMAFCSCVRESHNLLEDIDLIPAGSGSYYTLEGKRVIDGSEFTSVDFFSDGLARVVKDGRVLYINKKGETVIDAGTCSQGMYATGFWNGVAWKIPDEGKYAGQLVAFDTEGKELFGIQAQPVTMFNKQGKALIAIEGDKGDEYLDYAVVNKSGTLFPLNILPESEYIIIPPDFNNFVIHNNRVIFKSSKGDGVADLKGYMVIEPWTYDYSAPGYDLKGNVIAHCPGNNPIEYLLNKNGKELCSGPDDRGFVIDCLDGDRYRYEMYVSLFSPEVPEGDYAFGDEYGNVTHVFDHLNLSRCCFNGEKYAFLCNGYDTQTQKFVTYRFDREGNTRRYPYKMLTPLLGGKVYVAEDGRHRLILCDANGEMLDGAKECDIHAEKTLFLRNGIPYDANEDLPYSTSYGRPYIYIWWNSDSFDY